MAGKNDELDDFYAALKSGTAVASFLKNYERTIGFIHAENLTEDYRLARGRVKKLCDEVTPVARFVREYASLEDQIWFALDNTAPDCRVRHEGGRLREIEVTVAQAKERLFVMRELNRSGTARGFLGLTDDAPMENFEEKMAQPNMGYTEEEVVRSIICAVEICARKKGKFQWNTLLIEAPLETLRADRWDDFRAHLAERVKELAITEVYVTGRGSDGGIDRGICLRIK